MDQNQVIPLRKRNYMIFLLHLLRQPQTVLLPINLTDWIF